MFDDAESVLYSILAVIFIENFVDIYITLRQVKVYRTAQAIPEELKEHIDDETFQKARTYGYDQEVFGINKALVLDVAVKCLELYFGIIAYMWACSKNVTGQLGLDAENEIVVSIFFMVISNVLSTVKSLPFLIYKIFWLEEAHGFNKQTPAFFVRDQLKSFFVSQVIMVPIVAAVVYIVQRGGDNFFIWLWLFTCCTVFVFLTIYPIFIAPLFDKYTPLQEGELRQKIEELAASLNFPLTKLYVVAGSKRSSHSNAYFYGLWNSKRIVLYDTLLLNKGQDDGSELKEEDKGKGCTNEEVVAVLAHELGHWWHNHMVKNTIIMQVNMLLIFVVFSYSFQHAALYEAIGFPPCTRPIVVGLMVVLAYVLAPYNAIVNFAMTVLSRRFEYQADEFAHNLGYSTKLGHALVKLTYDNLGFPVHDWLYSAWNHSHPTLLQRLARLKQLDAKQGVEQKKTN